MSSVGLLAQELPPIQNFTSEDYNAENQNWSISQGDDKYIYVANSLGLLEYNGANWQLYESPNKTVLRSVEPVDNRVYSGGYMEFGFWKRNRLGVLEYTSLSQKLDIDLVEDEQFWDIIAQENWVLFQSLNRIYIVNTSDLSVKIIDSETELSKMTVSDGVFYFQKKGIGLFKIINGKAVLVSEDSILKSNTIVNTFQHDDTFLIQTQEKGFFVLDDKRLKQWDIPANPTLLTTNVFSSLKLKDDSFVLGTISNGIIFMTSQGEINYALNQNNGLLNNTVLSIDQDIDQNLWLGLDNGISFIDVTSPYRIYNDDSGRLGTIYASLVIQNTLYLGTNQGVFYRKRDTDEEFKFMEGTKGQVWALANIDNKLFCGHNKGTMIIEQNTVVNTIDEANGTWDFKPIPNRSHMILQGNFNGLNVLEKVENNWVYRNKIEGIDISSRFFEFANGKLYVNHELKGLYELQVDETYKTVEHINRIENIYKGVGSNIVNYNGDLIYVSSEGVYKQNQNREFKKDTSFSNLFKPFKTLTTLMRINGEPEVLWRYANDNIAFISHGAMSKMPNMKLFPISNSIKNVVAGFGNVTKISANEYLLGRYNGYLLINDDIIPPKKEFEILINNLEVHEIDQPKKRLDPTEAATFNNKTNNISFDYSFPNYGEIIPNKYQFQLLGLSDNWSDWSEQSSNTFENLPFGTYTFNVRGKSGNTLTNNIASYTFTIKRPLLLSNLAITLYLLSVIILLLIIHYYYRRYYRNQQRKVIEKSKRELELKELENAQELMGLRNEQLQQDIENKNRELAISTMSLIKKNEFLNSIKEELKSAEATKSLNSVIKIIDKNLNNTDDWKFFEEAFNNADKDFLKKVKAKHASLTPNDLKLCAYLRLNLSSKEIAPLLNISPKSVEVKRYRLRKKMDLPHESSLTNYILEI
ncbi:triple tyrosine motif-containing protein [Psychroserpens sp. SPM9]|uniref:helix-turn-helix and ligand-binding sensor domain-containing protein n=1 Tax=Psychroserpens sp. SPM9 TaxID=2975598 RepID=UPI0021A3101A|nr:triple tyrosine motif-containing protein [Psychroserpens sp. SPM9]MDG5491337.1 triple tyrosine motif-containing protein [Psychroserpens sp. SPM9]